MGAFWSTRFRASLGCAALVAVGSCAHGVDPGLGVGGLTGDDGGAGKGGSGGSDTATGGGVTTGAGMSTGMSGSMAGSSSGGMSGSGGMGGGASGSLDASTDATIADTGVDTSVPKDTGPDVPPCPGSGNALTLDGAGVYGTVTRLVQDNFTFEAWILLNGNSHTSTAGLDFWDGSGLIYADTLNQTNDFGMSILNNHVTFGVGGPDTTIVGAATITPGQWVHVAATRNKATGELQVLVGGNVDRTVIANNKNALTSPANITIGGNTLNSRYFKGSIDEVRFWNVVRSAADIQSTMNLRLRGNEPGLVGYWRFDETSGSTAAGSALQANSVTISGTPVWSASGVTLTCN